jgi:hypothetical protein
MLATWAEGAQVALIDKIFIRLSEADKGGAGLTAYLKLGWYPLVYLVYSAGIAALAARRFDIIASLFHVTVTSQTPYGEKARPLVITVGYRASELNEYFKLLPGHERHFVPRSEYLFKALQPTLEDLLMLGRKYEELFDQFELFLALEHSEMTESGWGPPGRFAWKHREEQNSPLERMTEEATREGENWLPLRAGLFHGSRDHFTRDAATLAELIRKLSWM